MEGISIVKLLWTFKDGDLSEKPRSASGQLDLEVSTGLY